VCVRACVCTKSLDKQKYINILLPNLFISSGVSPGSWRVADLPHGLVAIRQLFINLVRQQKRINSTKQTKFSHSMQSCSHLTIFHILTLWGPAANKLKSRVNVYMYLRTYVCMHVCMHVCMYACMMCVYVCMYVCMYVFMHVCIYACTCVYVWMYECMCVCMYVCMYVCVYEHANVCMYVSMYICMYVCMNLLLTSQKTYIITVDVLSHD